MIDQTGPPDPETWRSTISKVGKSRRGVVRKVLVGIGLAVGVLTTLTGLFGSPKYPGMAVFGIVLGTGCLIALNAWDLRTKLHRRHINGGTGWATGIITGAIACAALGWGAPPPKTTVSSQVTSATTTAAASASPASTPTPSATPSATPRISATPSASPTPPKLTTAQKQQVSDILAAGLQHYVDGWHEGQRALGSDRYPDSNAGLAAMADPNSAAMRFSTWRQSSGIEQDVTSYLASFRKADAFYTADNEPDAISQWRDDIGSLQGDIGKWTTDAVGWQIRTTTDATMALDVQKINADAATVVADATATLAAS